MKKNVKFLSRINFIKQSADINNMKKFLSLVAFGFLLNLDFALAKKQGGRREMMRQAQEMMRRAQEMMDAQDGGQRTSHTGEAPTGGDNGGSSTSGGSGTDGSTDEGNSGADVARDANKEYPSLVQLAKGVADLTLCAGENDEVNRAGNGNKLGNIHFFVRDYVKKFYETNKDGLSSDVAKEKAKDDFESILISYIGEKRVTALGKSEVEGFAKDLSQILFDDILSKPTAAAGLSGVWNKNDLLKKANEGLAAFDKKLLAFMESKKDVKVTCDRNTDNIKLAARPSQIGDEKTFKDNDAAKKAQGDSHSAIDAVPSGDKVDSLDKGGVEKGLNDLKAAEQKVDADLKKVQDSSLTADEKRALTAEAEKQKQAIADKRDALSKRQAQLAAANPNDPSLRAAVAGDPKKYSVKGLAEADEKSSASAKAEKEADENLSKHLLGLGAFDGAKDQIKTIMDGEGSDKEKKAAIAKLLPDTATKQDKAKAFRLAQSLATSSKTAKEDADDFEKRANIFRSNNDDNPATASIVTQVDKAAKAKVDKLNDGSWYKEASGYPTRPSDVHNLGELKLYRDTLKAQLDTEEYKGDKKRKASLAVVQQMIDAQEQADRLKTSLQAPATAPTDPFVPDSRQQFVDGQKDAKAKSSTASTDESLRQKKEAEDRFAKQLTEKTRLQDEVTRLRADTSGSADVAIKLKEAEAELEAVDAYLSGFYQQGPKKKKKR